MVWTNFHKVKLVSNEPGRSCWKEPLKAESFCNCKNLLFQLSVLWIIFGEDIWVFLKKGIPILLESSCVMGSVREAQTPVEGAVKLDSKAKISASCRTSSFLPSYPLTEQLSGKNDHWVKWWYEQSKKPVHLLYAGNLKLLCMDSQRTEMLLKKLFSPGPPQWDVVVFCCKIKKVLLHLEVHGYCRAQISHASLHAWSVLEAL